MFAVLMSDTPYTKSSPATAAAHASVAPPATSLAPNPVLVNKAAVHAMIENASVVKGQATAVKSALEGSGFKGSLLSVGTAAATTSTTTVYYPPPAPIGRRGRRRFEHPVLGHATEQQLLTSDGGHRHGLGQQYHVRRVGRPGIHHGRRFRRRDPAPTALALSPPSSSLLTRGNASKACMNVPQPEW